MLVRNERLLQCIENSIIEYNNQFYKKEDEDKKIPYFDYNDDYRSAEISEDILGKLDNLRIVLNVKKLEDGELKEITEQLPEILDKMNLKKFGFSMMSKDIILQDVDLSFVEHLNDELEYLELIGIDLSEKGPEFVDRFEELKYLSLQKANITSTNIISNVKSNPIIALDGNTISPENYEDAIELIEKMKGNISFSDPKLKMISRIYRIKQVGLLEYLNLCEKCNFDDIENLKIIVNNDNELENIDEFESIIELLNKKNNIQLDIPIQVLKRIDKEGKLAIPTKVNIENVGQLDNCDLLKHKCISDVLVNDIKNRENQENNTYSYEMYFEIRSKIDEIISRIEVADEADKDREKKIFAQVYKILGKMIDYDFNAIKPEEQSDKELQKKCRNMQGALLDKKCVCVGYADTLRNVLSCFGIYSEQIGSSIDLEAGIGFDLRDPNGHAWNLVELDGKKYWTDLTWDANNIKMDRYDLKYCLKSTRDFKHERYKKRLEDKMVDPCKESMEIEELEYLFTGKKTLRDKEEVQEDSEIGYLSSFTMDAINNGLCAGEIKNMAKKCRGICLINDKDKEEAKDGRD